VRAEVEENLVARQHPRAAVIEAHLERRRCDKPRAAHDQFGAGCPVVVQMEFDLALDHVALALAYLCHVRRDRTGGHRAELGCVMRLMRYPGAPNLVLAWQAGDVGTISAHAAVAGSRAHTRRNREQPSAITCAQIGASPRRT